ncbi:MAG: hypothetical protein RRB13_11365 [bacterium]|nr:hypothetical protein [bacterium]
MNMRREEPAPAETAAVKSIAKKLAQKIVFISQREMETDKAYTQIAALLHEKLYAKDKVKYFQSMLQTLLDDEETETYAASAMGSIYWEDSNPDFKEFWQQIIEMMVAGHRMGDMPSYRHPDSGKIFSAYAHTLGESFIQLMKVGSDNYDLVSELYSFCIRYENDLERRRREALKNPRSAAAKEFSAPANPKHLYDDLADFIEERAVFRARTLNPDNPNEFIQILSDRLRSTRRYVIQDLINKDSIDKKRSLEKALQEKQASAEELVYAAKPFRQGLTLYKDAKLYNNRYVEAEKRRVTFQLVPMILAVSLIGASMMDLVTLGLEEMIGLGLLAIAGRFLFNQKLMKRFYPSDMTDELEAQVGLLAPVLQKCSREQLSGFIQRQIKEVSNPHELALMQEFVTYVFSLIPKRRELLISRKDLREFIEGMSWHVSRARRGLISSAG